MTVIQFTSLWHYLWKGGHEVFRHPCKVSCGTSEGASSPAGSVEEGGCGCRLSWVEVVPQKAPSGASEISQVAKQQLITCWGFSELMPPGCSAAQCDSLPLGETDTHCYSWPGQAAPEMPFQGKNQRDTGLHAPGLARWGVIAGMSEDCETGSRTAASRTFCTLALKCYPCFSVRSAFPFFHWISLTAAACLPPCRACGNEPWRGFSGIKELLWKSPILSPFDRAAGKLGMLFCSRDLQQGSSFSRESSHVANIIFKITMVKIFVMLYEGSHGH